MIINNIDFRKNLSLTFEGDIPEDKHYADGPNDFFSYEIFLNGKPVDEYGKRYAESIKIGNKYVWVYYWLYDNKKQTIDYPYIPGLIDDWVNFSIKKVERKKLVDEIEITANLHYADDYYTWNNGKITTIEYKKRSNINILVNGININKFFIIDDKKFNFEFKFSVIGKQVFNNMNLTFEFENLDEAFPASSSICIEQDIFLNLKTDTEIDANFLEGEKITIYSPIKYDGESNEYSFEEINLEKKFDDKFNYPTTINNLVDFYYDDNTTEFIPANIIIDYSIIEMVGYYDEELVIDVFHKENKYQFLNNTPMYYDEEINQVKKGNSGGKYLDEKGIVLPWDISNNEGVIKFNIKFKTYYNYKINLTLKIGNILSLRGEEGRFEFIEVNNIE
ncbi:MAG: hypothetical protein HRS50_01770 [Mycoplasmataceae bacterium]|nr:hypothetical protein [Mycoplasmataceae bacterium]